MAVVFASPPVLSSRLSTGFASLSATASSRRRRPARALKVAAYQMSEMAQGHTAEWKVPMAQDGWVLSHDALRLDLSDLSRLLDALNAQVAAGRPLEKWQAEAAAAAWRYHAHMLTVHHDSEEELYFPLLRTRFPVPQKQSQDHKDICELMEECGRKFSALVSAAPAVQAADLAGLKGDFGRFRSLCEEHYKEEEVVTLPLIREFFAPEEITPTARKIAKLYGLMDMGNYLRPMSGEQQTAWMTRVRMPFFIQWLMKAQVWRYDWAVVQPLEKAIAASKA